MLYRPHRSLVLLLLLMLFVVCLHFSIVGLCTRPQDTLRGACWLPQSIVRCCVVTRCHQVCPHARCSSQSLQHVRKSQGPTMLQLYPRFEEVALASGFFEGVHLISRNFSRVCPPEMDTCEEVSLWPRVIWHGKFCTAPATVPGKEGLQARAKVHWAAGWQKAGREPNGQWEVSSSSRFLEVRSSNF